MAGQDDRQSPVYCTKLPTQVRHAEPFAQVLQLLEQLIQELLLR
jgi:hypothetical protein